MKNRFTGYLISTIIIICITLSLVNNSYKSVHAAPLGVAPINDPWWMHENVNPPFPYTYSGDNTEATTFGNDPYLSCLGPTDQGMGSVWYRYSPVSNGTITIDTFGSTTDTVLGVWQPPAAMDPQTPADWTPATQDAAQSCNDDFDFLIHGTDSQVEFQVNSGDILFIEVATARNGQGNFVLNVSFTPSPPTDTPTATLVPTDTETPTQIPTDTETPTLVPTDTETPTLIPTDTETPTLLPTDTETPTLLPTDTASPTSSPSNTSTPTSSSTPKVATATPKPLYAYKLVHSGNFGNQTTANCRAIGYAQKVNSGTGTIFIRIYVDDIFVTGKYSAKGGLINFDLLTLPGNPFTLGVLHDIKLMAILENGQPYFLINPATHLPGGKLTCSAPAASATPTYTPVGPTSTASPTPSNTPISTATSTPVATATPKPLYAYNLVHSGYFGSQSIANCRAIGYAQKVNSGTGTVYIRIYVDDILVAGKYTARGGGINFDLLSLPGNPFTLGVVHNIKLKAILENGQPYYLINPLTHQPGGFLTCQ